MPSEGISFKAGGNVSPCTFVKADSTVWQVVAGAAGTDKPLGIASEATRNAPIEGQSAYAAISGDDLKVYLPGNVCLLKIGTGGCTFGDELEATTGGLGVTVTGSAVHEVGAIALETASANEFCRVLVTRYTRTI